MTTAKLLGLTLLGSASLIASVADAQLVQEGGRPFTVQMTGAAERPGPGDPDGSGTARFMLNPGQGRVCFELTVANIAPATAAHIHVADVNNPGPVVVPLAAPSDGDSAGCVDADRELIKAIIKNPENYYVNVHNADFPAGAVRGQLAK
ncbi:MAG: CHRD domain-containing protein [Pseudomonadota bacterium]|nr:CHRD domain-containing protein [Pseudomonadota bacterium]